MSNFDFDFKFRLKNMGEKTQENLLMGYSAAYPTGRELGEKWVSEGVGSWSSRMELEIVG